MLVICCLFDVVYNRFIFKYRKNVANLCLIYSCSVPITQFDVNMVKCVGNTSYEPCREKICHSQLRPGKIRTCLLIHRSYYYITSRSLINHSSKGVNHKDADQTAQV